MFLAKITDTLPTVGNVWGAARTIICLGPILTLLLNSPSEINISRESLASVGRCDGFYSITFPCAVGNGEYGLLTHLFLLFSFLLIATGYFPQVTGVLHVYAAFSYSNSLSTADGGEHVSLVFSVISLPICLAYPRISHWLPWIPSAANRKINFLRNSTGNIFFFLLKLQICLIYIVAAVSKLAVPEWREGTSFYYWTLAPYLGPVDPLKDLLPAIASVSLVALFGTYVPLLLEGLLGISLLLPNKWRKPLLFTGILFHLAIGMVFSIWSFVFVMLGMLLVLLGPTNFNKIEISVSKSDTEMR